jgi:hypothetical protein
MKVQVLDEAIDDLAAGHKFYQQQAEGLGSYFLDTLWSDIQSLSLYAGVHSMYYGLYRLLSKRFPFAIYYKIENEVVKVHAVVDGRRNPGYILQRLA